MRGAQERALLVPDDDIVIYGSCTIIKMKTTDSSRSSTQQVQAGVQQHFSLTSMLYTKVQYSTSTDCCTPTYVHVVCSNIESNSVLVADGNTTSAVSSTRREELDQNTYGLRNR